MEKLDEIKDGVKNRLIDLMAEQITKEESFAQLKDELVVEFFTKKVQNTKIVNRTIGNLFEENFVTSRAKNRFERRAEFEEDVQNIKSGKAPMDLRKFMSTELDQDSSTYKQLFELLENDKKIRPEFDELLTNIHNKERIDRIKNESLNTIKEFTESPMDSNFGTFEVRSFNNGDNYYKTYSLQNKLKKFTFACSYVHNNVTNENLIDNLYIDSSGYVITNEELGITFAISSMEMLDKADSLRQKAASFLKDTKENEIIPTEIMESTSEITIVNEEVKNEEELRLLNDLFKDTPKIEEEE